MDYGLGDILKLMEKKYPASYRKGINPALFIYDDESGKILKEAERGAYDSGNELFAFNSIQELYEHLKGGDNGKQKENDGTVESEASRRA